MFKSNAELLWEAHSAQNLNRASKNYTFEWLYGYLNTVKQILKYFTKTSLLNSLINHQECKVRAIEDDIKDTFFYSHSVSRDSLEQPDYFGRNKVPNKIWKRHSALLVYQHQVCRQKAIHTQIKTVVVADQALSSSNILANNEPSGDFKR